MTDTPRLSCIIPAYNEAPRIGAVLAAVLDHPLICEVIVVDDGSSDGTADRAEALATDAPTLRVIRQPQNGGKSRAVATGIEAARGEHLLLLDSDLLGLDADHLSDLIAPVLERRADAAISLRRNAPLLWRALGIDYISGERVMPRALLAAHTATLRGLPRFGLEVFINRLWLSDGLRLAIVRWPGVDSPLKHTKRGGWVDGLRADAAMLRDIFRTVPPSETLRQILALRARRI
ncbi:glycosyltransferase family 2 protein [Salipiger abyssi]|uniref:glycosyltransferase family 2 protein n=1 Tax=Salipiger abyssi TaxID=1250539 RepID=UPI001A8F8156|nr:glycosyltransferase family 2 protein [Salipiger abyssi]MBN9886872.1 glycosyltransferase family 2 protein [Salipiger abyssi]